MSLYRYCKYHSNICIENTTRFHLRRNSPLFVLTGKMWCTHEYVDKLDLDLKTSLIARFLGPTWGPSGADGDPGWLQVGPMNLLSGLAQSTIAIIISNTNFLMGNELHCIEHLNSKKNTAMRENSWPLINGYQIPQNIHLGHRNSLGSNSLRVFTMLVFRMSQKKHLCCIKVRVVTYTNARYCGCVKSPGGGGGGARGLYWDKCSPLWSYRNDSFW